MLDCKFNSLITLNLQGCSALQQLYANNNSLTSLDLSYNEALGNSNFYLDLRTNPLTSICITPKQFTNKQWGNYPVAAVWDTLCGSSANFINFSDANFKQALLQYSSKIDLNSDGEISVYEAKKVTGLAVNNKNISSLSGIEHFVNITTLNCSDNNLMNLSVPNNKLIALVANNCELSTIDISLNTALVSFTCENNQLNTINTSANSKLEELWCSNNSIAHLNFNSNPALRVVVCKNNLLTAIDLSQNANLTSFHANNNLFTYIDYRNNAKLYAYSNELADNPKLKMICVTEAHLSNNSGWTKPDHTVYSSTCDTNEVTYIDFPDTLFRNFLIHKAIVSKLVGNSVTPLKIDANLDNKISIKEAEAVHFIHCAGLSYNVDSSDWFTNIAGIEYFVNLKSLAIDNMPLQTVSISGFNEMDYLTLNKCQLTNLSITDLQKLEVLSFIDNQLSSVELTNLPLVKVIAAQNNQIKNIEITQFKKLKDFQFENNENLTVCATPEQVDTVTWTISSTAKLDTICGQNPIPIKDKKVIAALLAHVPVIDLNGDSIITVEEALKVKTLNITYLNLPNLDGFEVFKSITTLNVSGNNLTKIDVTVFAYLKQLYASKNYIAIFAFLTSNQIIGGKTTGEGDNSSLEVIDLSDNNLSELDVSNIVSLDSLAVSGNPQLEFVCVNSTQLSDKTSYWTKDITTNWSNQNCLRTTSTISLNSNFFPAYPNPAENQIFVSEKVQGIYTVSGSLAQVITNSSSSITLNLSPGLYFIRYESGKTEKLIIQ